MSTVCLRGIGLGEITIDATTQFSVSPQDIESLVVTIKNHRNIVAGSVRANEEGVITCKVDWGNLQGDQLIELINEMYSKIKQMTENKANNPGRGATRNKKKPQAYINATGKVGAISS